MSGMNRFNEKDRRKQRRQLKRNHVAKDLYTPKYKQQIIPSRKRVDNEEDGSYYFRERYWDEHE